MPLQASYDLTHYQTGIKSDAALFRAVAGLIVSQSPALYDRNFLLVRAVRAGTMADTSTSCANALDAT
jgi:hypothetical protein